MPVDSSESVGDASRKQKIQTTARSGIAPQSGWREACDHARRAGDDLEGLSDRLFASPGARSNDPARARVPRATPNAGHRPHLRLLLFLALALTTRIPFPPTATFPHPSPSPDADSPECRGTLVSALRVYSKASSSAENGRHDVAVDLCTEVRPDPLTPVDYTKACSDISVNRINARDPFLAFSAVGAIRPPPLSGLLHLSHTR